MGEKGWCWPAMEDVHGAQSSWLAGFTEALSEWGRQTLDPCCRCLCTMYYDRLLSKIHTEIRYLGRRL